MTTAIAPRTTTTFYPFGTLLRSARLEKGLSLRALAKALGVSHEYIHQVEKGYVKAMPPSIYPRLSTLLGVAEEEWESRLHETPYKNNPPFPTPPPSASTNGDT